MKARITTALVCVLLAAAISVAHEGMEHVMGTVKAISANSITVQTTGQEPREVTIALLPSTKFSMDGADTTAKALKIGQRVVVHAKPNAGKLEAAKVVFGKTSEHMDMHH
jgi:hypothetical protein